MEVALEGDEYPISYNDTVREYGLVVLDGPNATAGGTTLVLGYCPFCGAPLPAALSDRWFERLELLGIEWGDPDTPLNMRSGAWWRRPADGSDPL